MKQVKIFVFTLFFITLSGTQGICKAGWGIWDSPTQCSPQTIDPTRIPCIKTPYVDTAVKSCKATSIIKVTEAGNLGLYFVEFELKADLSNSDNSNNELFSERGAAFFYGNKNSKKLCGLWHVWDGGGAIYFEKPEVADSKFGKIIKLPMGSGNAVHSSLYFIANSGHWQELDVTGFISRLKLPEGYRAATNEPDLKTGIFRSPVLTQKDCHACSTGGFIEAELSRQENALIIKSQKYEAPKVAPKTSGS